MTPYYQDDWTTIYHGDCREVLPGLPKVDLVLTDPPYSISVKGTVHDSTQHKQGTRRLDFFEGDDDWDAMTLAVIDALSICDAPVYYVWCGHRQFGSIVELLEGTHGMKTKPLVWRKKVPVPAPPNSGFASGLELCVYAYTAGRTWNVPNPAPSNVLEFDSYRHGQPGKVDHPTQKPLKMIATLLGYSSNEGDTILDPFMGSGTTLRAAKDLNRKAIGIEIEERYCEIAARRLQQEVFDFGEKPAK